MPTLGVELNYITTQKGELEPWKAGFTQLDRNDHQLFN